MHDNIWTFDLYSVMIIAKIRLGCFENYIVVFDMKLREIK